MIIIRNTAGRKLHTSYLDDEQAALLEYCIASGYMNETDAFAGCLFDYERIEFEKTP